MGLPKPKDFDFNKVTEELQIRNPLRDMLHLEQDPEEVEPAPPNYQVQDCLNQSRMNKEQLSCFRQVRQAIINADKADYKGQRLFLLHGSGGTGKTFVYNSLITWCKSKDRVAIACASTGIAARLLSGGQTAHSTFGIMNDVGPNQPSNMPFESLNAEKLRSASLIIIDEISMLHRNVFEYIDRVMQSVQYRDTKRQPFGGKVFLIGGDFKQLLPVVQSACIQDQINASLKTSSLYDLFKRFDLVQNMRVNKDEASFSEFLEEVGNGTNFIENTTFMFVPSEMRVYTREDLIEFCFPRNLLQHPVENIDGLSNAAILAPTNLAVEFINLQVLECVAGEERIFSSTDSLQIAGDSESLMAHNIGGLQVNVGDNVLEMIHERMPTGFPPHNLHLKVGAVVMLIKNLCVSDGLCNGTRLQIVSMGDNLLRCRVLSRQLSFKKKLSCLAEIGITTLVFSLVQSTMASFLLAL
uniref:ATP-dependent DNA helicase n=1 Tax=Romanomermis culicivorax TaxID=13658 RepID=A0A915K6N5_ROMCU